MKISFLKPIFLAAFAIFSLSACSDDENNTTPQSKPTYDMTGFAKGADVSWLTEMEKAGSKFYNASGAEQDCMTLLRDLGVNSIRLRVWVDPQDGWSGKQDVLAKAWRAKNLGQRIMIDFHYSDSWADPGKQNIPAAWTDFKDDLQKMKAAVAEHTTDVLSFLKENGIDVEWIQIGNETTTGMLWPLGLASDNNFANYAALNNAGYDAAKAVYPDAQCIIHIDQGNPRSLHMDVRRLEGCRRQVGRHRHVALSGGRQLADGDGRLSRQHLYARRTLQQEGDGVRDWHGVGLGERCRKNA